MIQFDSNWWYAEATRLRRRINNLPFDSKIPLVRLSNDLDKMVAQVLKEEIACRRKGRQTERHAALLEQFHALRDEFDNNTTLALLMK